MPDNEELEFERLLAGQPEPDPVGASEEDEEAQFEAQLAQEVAPQSPDIAHARDLAAGVPLHGEQTPSAEQPWYQNAFKDAPIAAVLSENLASGALANTADEIGAAAISPDRGQAALHDQVKFGVIPPEENQYAAGSAFEDNRRTLEAEKLQRDEAAPGWATAGQIGGGALQAGLLPVAATGTALGGLASGAGLTAANYMGQGSGDLSERAGQAVETVKEHPLSTAAGVVLPAAVGGASQLAGKAAPALSDMSAINRVAAFTNPAWRAKYMANKGGEQGLINLGKDITSRGLHLPGGPNAPWYKNLGPASAANMYRNAVKYGAEDAGPRLGAAEGVIAQTNPLINTGEIASDLRAGADDVLLRADEAAARPEAGFRQDLASGLEKNQTKLTEPVRGPMPAPKPLQLEGPLTPEVPAVPAQEVKPEEWYSFLKDVQSREPGSPLPQAPQMSPGQPAVPSKFFSRTDDAAEIPDPIKNQDFADYQAAEKQFRDVGAPTGKSKFTDVVADRRHMDKQANYMTAGGIDNAGMKDSVRRQTTAAMRQQTAKGLDEAVAADPGLQKPVQDWRTANKDFSVAATMEDPALAEMSKEYGGGLGLKDMATASIAQSLGVPSGASLALSKGLKGGRGHNAIAGTQQNMSSLLDAVSGKSPGTLGATQAALPDPEVQKEKNQSLKDQMTEAMSAGWNWTKQLLK